MSRLSLPRTELVRLNGTADPIIVTEDDVSSDDTVPIVVRSSPKSVFVTRSVPSDESDEDIRRPITPPPMRKRDTAVIAPVTTTTKVKTKKIVKPVTTTEIIEVEESKSPVRQSISGRSSKISQLDLDLTGMGFTILFSFRLLDGDGDSTRMILAMTPIGTIVGIKLDIEGDITAVPEKRIDIIPSTGNNNLQTSYLTTISRATEAGSIVMCKDGLCVLARDNGGKIEAQHYDIKLPSDVSSGTSDTPTSYPLVSLREIIASFRDSNNLVNYAQYSSYLISIEQLGRKISASEIGNQMIELEMNIKFMSSLLDNLKDIHGRTASFVEANNLEFKTISMEALGLLGRRLTVPNISQQEADLWQRTQDRLASLNYNNVTVANGLKTFNEFRTDMNDLDRDAYMFYFTLCNRAFRSIETPQNMDIRRPSGWTLDRVLPTAESSLIANKGKISIEDFNAIVRGDMTRFDALKSDGNTIELYKAFQSCFTS